MNHDEARFKKQYFGFATTTKNCANIYIKHWVAKLEPERSKETAKNSGWIEWIHRNLSDKHCEVCLSLNGCWFLKTKAPTWPHHQYCHCVLKNVDYSKIILESMALSKYSKFDPYLFNVNNAYPHKKQEMFLKWGYTVEDSKWLQKEIEKQALEKYRLGDYKLGVLDRYGQRISIRVEIPRKISGENVSFITGWTVLPSGRISLNTPYGGK